MATHLVMIPQKIVLAVVAINSLVILGIVDAAHSMGMSFDLEKISNSADFINQNSINQNSIGNSVPGGGGGGNGVGNGFGANPAQSTISSTFGIAAEERMVMDTYVLAFINYTYIDETGNLMAIASENAKYGEGKVMTVYGKLVHVTSAHDVTDNTACHMNIRGTKGVNLPPKGVHWIALIKRGKCNFEDKVKHAFAHHAAGVIVYNDKDSLTLDKMKINDKDRNITAIFTYKKTGEQLAKLLEDGYELDTSISPGDKVSKHYQNMNRTSVLFVSISFIILMIISLVWLVFYYIQRFRYLQSKDKQSRRMCNVAKRIIAKIPTKAIKADDKEFDNDCCPVCIELYKMNDVIRVLPCKHEYHKNCIDPWLLEHRTCPMCKMDILKHYGFVFTGSQESILQMDLDVGEMDMDEGNESPSPLPQIRSERMLSRSSSLNSDTDVQIINEATPSLTEWTSKKAASVNSSSDNNMLSCSHSKCDGPSATHSSLNRSKHSTQAASAATTTMTAPLPPYSDEAPLDQQSSDIEEPVNSEYSFTSPSRKNANQIRIQIDDVDAQDESTSADLLRSSKHYI